MDDLCLVTIDTTDYYVECSRISDLSFVDGELVNVSNSSITLVTSFSLDSYTYPRIVCSGMRTCGLRTSDRSEAVPVKFPIVITRDFFKSFNFEFLVIFLLLMILGVRLLWKN